MRSCGGGSLTRLVRGRAPSPHQQNLPAALLFVLANSGCIHGNQSLLQTLPQRLVRVDRRFGISDRFEAGFHFKVERERSVVRQVRGIAFHVETPARRFLGTGALDDRARLTKFTAESENALNLITVRERASVKKDLASGSFV